ncbi:hypothetical protein ACN38_g8772 [Penicillium nordicum]|uniref:Uncharacterized protein n=1 Tax=Penicillium nordicum TaxID=229535 RepID=A0A0M8NWN3_9EURO|nr:hypothetical protein ACN38_g8772 [Penicillium nordicum]
MSQCVYYTEDSTHLAPETRRRASTDCRGFVPNPNLNMIPSLFFGKYIKAHFGNIADDRQLEAPLTEHLGRPRDPYLSKHKQEPWKVSTAATKLCNTRCQVSNQGFAGVALSGALKLPPIPMQKKIGRPKKKILGLVFRNSRTRGSNPQP